MHRHLFQDVYDWAGEPRTIRTFKDGSPFGYPETFDGELTKLFTGLADRDYLRGRDADAFAEGAAYFLGELNAIHLFREGNGRAQTAFLAMLAAEAGHPLDLTRLAPDAWMHAMVTSAKLLATGVASSLTAPLP